MSDRQRDHKDDDKRAPRRVPLLPLRDIVVFPHMVVPLFVGREKSISALEEAMGKGGYKEIFLSAQRKAKTNEPVPDDIFTVGTIGQIIQLLRLPDGTVKVLVEGKRRARIRKFVSNEEFFVVEVEELPEPIDDPARLADTIVAALSLKLVDKQSILETESPTKRLEKLFELMQAEIEI